MKNFTIIICILTLVLIQNTVFSQTSTEVEKQKQIDGYIAIIKNNNNAQEVEKAKAYLAELGVKYEESIPVQSPKVTEAEEQKKMSETLSPAQYDAWKAEKYKSSVIKPIEVPKDTVKTNK